jgi:hypothetical protein
VKTVEIWENANEGRILFVAENEDNDKIILNGEKLCGRVYESRTLSD